MQDHELKGGPIGEILKRVAIIQARMSSTRLPGKVLRPILGKPMLALLLERVRRCRNVDRIVVATTTNSLDEPVAELVSTRPDVMLFRGEEKDVLSRYYEAAKAAGADIILRITADNPFFDWQVADPLLDLLTSGSYDFVANNFHPSFPHGIDLEAFTFAALRRANVKASTAHEREHVTPYIRCHGELFRHGDLRHEVDMSSIRLTVDTSEDYQRAVRLFEQFDETVTFREIADVADL